MTARGVLIAAALVAASPAAAQVPPEPTFSKDELAAMRTSCERAEPACDPVALLSKLERRAVDRVILARGLELERAPHGKRVGRVEVVPLDVFGPGEGFLRWFNVFHATTRPESVRRELIVGPGDAWDQRDIDESARRLRDPISTSLVAIVPVRSPVEGEVDVLVVTRDVWSLRMNSNYEYQGNELTYLTVSLSENNLLGLRKLLAVAFVMRQATYTIGPVYVDKNLLGEHIDLRGRAAPIWNRETSDIEGSESIVTLSRPLWSRHTEWGAGLDWAHKNEIYRLYQGPRLLDYDNPDTVETENVPWRYRYKTMSISASGVRAFGDRVEQRVKAGYELAVQRPSLLDDFPDDPVLQAAFTRDVLPRSERTSVLFVGWDLLESRFRNYQNVSTFELAEDNRMGVELGATAGFAHTLIGSEFSFIRLSGSAGYTGAWLGDGLWRARVAATTRIEDGEAIDNVVDLRLRLVTPTLGIGRLVTELKLSGLYIDRQNQYYRLGGDSGLRGYPINEFIGDRRAVWNTEFRTRPVPVLFTRWGLVGFHEIGGAASSFRSMQLFQDVGFGLRALIPQVDPDVFRFDFAFALDDVPDPMAGRFRFTAGYEQTF